MFWFISGEFFLRDSSNVLTPLSHIVEKSHDTQSEFLSDEIKPWDLYQTSKCSQAFVPELRALSEVEGNPQNENRVGVRS